MFKNLIKTIPHASHGSSSEGVERDRPESLFILKLSFVLIITLAVLWVLFEGLMWSTNAEMEAENLAARDAKLSEVRMAEESQIHGYDVSNKEKGFYQIPIEQAIDKLVRQGSVELK